jgi:4-alpha-glucanotransferase
LLAIALEDILGMEHQTNVPGTVFEHPNWRRRMSVTLEDLREHGGLAAIAEIANVLRDARRMAAT